MRVHILIALLIMITTVIGVAPSTDVVSTISTYDYNSYASQGSTTAFKFRLFDASGEPLNKHVYSYDTYRLENNSWIPIELKQYNTKLCNDFSLSLTGNDYTTSTEEVGIPAECYLLTAESGYAFIELYIDPAKYHYNVQYKIEVHSDNMSSEYNFTVKEGETLENILPSWSAWIQNNASYAVIVTMIILVISSILIFLIRG